MKKVLSIILGFLSVFAFLFAGSTNTVALALEDAVIDTSLPEYAKDRVILFDSKQDLFYHVGSETNLFRYIDEDDFIEMNHIGRIESLETFSSYVFYNSDGTLTSYYLDDNVKYCKNGTIIEKNISLIETPNGYTTKSNDIGVVLGQNSISVQYDNSSLCLLPYSSVADCKMTCDGTSVYYKGVFGDSAILKYTPTMSGIKEDIIISKYEGVNEYTFTLIVDSLTLEKNDKHVRFHSSDNNDVSFEFGDIVVYDSIGNTSYGNIVLKQIKDNTYCAKVVVDSSFLQSSETVYPVTVDPTITVSDSLMGTGAVEDAPLYSGKPSNNYANNIYLCTGYVDSTYKTGRTIMRFPGLYTDTVYLSLPEASIQSADLHLRLGSSSTGIVMIYANKTQATQWNESTVTWSNCPAHYSDRYWTITETNNYWDTYDITTLVRSWRYGKLDAEAGIVMINTAESLQSNCRTFLSSEHSNESYKPYLTVTYKNMNTYLSGDNAFLYNRETNKFVVPLDHSTASGATIVQESFDGSSAQRWALLYNASTGMYRMYNRGSSKFLAVLGNSTSNNSSIVQVSSTSDITYWNISIANHPSFTLMGECASSYNRVLSVYPYASDPSADDVPIKHRTYVNDSVYYDEWVLIDKKNVSLISIPESYDRESYFINIERHVIDNGYSDVYNSYTSVYNTSDTASTSNAYSMTTAELMARVALSDIVLIRTHGSTNGTGITTGDSGYNVNKLNSLPSVYRNTGLVIYACCYAGKGGENGNNILNATVAAGANSAIGFEDPVIASAVNKWSEVFFEKMVEFSTDSTKDLYDVLMATDEVLENDPCYACFSSDGLYCTLENPVLCGSADIP